jgi:hypothetical protein
LITIIHLNRRTPPSTSGWETGRTNEGRTAEHDFTTRASAVERRAGLVVGRVTSPARASRCAADPSAQKALIGSQKASRPSSYALPFWTIIAVTRPGCLSASPVADRSAVNHEIQGVAFGTEMGHQTVHHATV